MGSRSVELRACGGRSYFFWMRQAYEHARDDRWYSVTAPALILHGAKDGVTEYKFAEALARDIASSELVTFREEDHMLLLNKPKEIAHMMHGFLHRIARAQ
jgi:pimeloyl-ACP methyl ester carboxylesterase